MTKSHHRNSQIHLYCIAVLQWQRSLTDILKREAAGENALSRIWFKCEFTHFFTPTVWQQPSVCHRKGRGPPQWPKTYAIRTSFDFLHGNQCLILVIWIKRMWISGVETFCLLFHARSEDRWLVTINLAHGCSATGSGDRVTDTYVPKYLYRTANIHTSWKAFEKSQLALSHETNLIRGWLRAVFFLFLILFHKIL